VPTDVPDLGGAQEGRSIAELRRITDAAGGGAVGALLHQFTTDGLLPAPASWTPPPADGRSGTGQAGYKDRILFDHDIVFET